MALNPSSINRRQFLALVGAGGASLALGACSGGPGAAAPSSANGTSAFNAKNVKGVINLARWPAGGTTGTMAKIIAAFEKKYPGAKVVDTITPSAEYQSTELLRMRNSGAGDVFMAFRGSQYTSMVSAGLYSDLTGQPFISNYYSQYLTTFRSGGKQFGLPYLLLFLMPTYNVDLFDKVGISSPPTTWQGFLSMCQTLKSKGYIPIAWPGATAGDNAQLLHSMVMN
ncbi:MAG: ABC transporter substrate-binding protein, partial [Acidimicrobiales bacterium]